MKTISGAAGFALLAVVAIIAVFIIRPFALATPTPAPTSTLTPCSPGFVSKKKIAKPIGGPGPNNYAELKKSQADFDNALVKLETNGGQYCIRFLSGAQGARPEEPYDPHHRQASINTDKVTKSEVANTTASDAVAANDPNAINRLYSDSADDIQAVLDCFK